MKNKRQMLFLIANAIMFQVGWLVCVGLGNIAALVFTVLVSGAHLFWVKSPRADACAGIIAVALGLIHDNCLAAAGVFVFSGTISPPWLWCLWWLLGLTLRHSLLWLYRRPLLGSLLGPVSACFSYSAGVLLSNVLWGVPVEYGLFAIAALWLVILPLHRWIFCYFFRDDNYELAI